MGRLTLALAHDGYDPLVRQELIQLTSAIQRSASTEGVWSDLTDTSLFGGASLMTWTVELRDLDARWTVIGDTLLLNLNLSNTTVGGTVSGTLRMRLPNGYTAKRNAVATCAIGDNSSTKVLGTVAATKDSPFLAITRFDGANFTASTNNTSVSGQIAVEVRQ